MDDDRNGPLRIVVTGDPQTQGNKSAILTGLVALTGKAGPRTPRCPRCHLAVRGMISMIEGRRDDSRRAFKDWRARVAWAAKAAAAARGMTQPLDGPLGVKITFTLDRPDSHYSVSGGKRTSRVKASFAAAEPDTIPDGDKLQRAVFDALAEAKVIANDSRFTEWHGEKVYLRDHPGLGGLGVGNPTVMCGAYGADAMAGPGCVIRVWQRPRQAVLNLEGAI